MLLRFQRCFFVRGVLVLGICLLVSLFQDETIVVAMVPTTPATPSNHNAPPPLVWRPKPPRRRKQSIQLLADRALAIRRQNLHLPFICVGVAGGPGSGKSTLTANVATWINNNARNATNHDGQSISKEKAVVIPMDGYHYSKEQLREMAGTEEAYESLLRKRGSPPTINAPQLVEDFQALDTFRRRNANAEPAEMPTFPDYSRQQSDPVPNALTIPSDTTIVFCEGLYVLAFDSPNWAPLQEIWDDTVFLSVSEVKLKERLIGRHMKRWTKAKRDLWGPGRNGAAAKVEANDLQNARWVTQHSQHHAQVILHNYF